MAKSITRIVLTGGPAGGKTTLISRLLKEFKQEDGWKVITVPETATELISGFGIKPFGNCVSMRDFQYFVVEDQLHKEKLALKAARMVPEEKILIVYDRGLLDQKAYVDDDEFRELIAYFGKTEEQALACYDAVLHLVTCAKGAEYAYNYGNAARYESVEVAREKDDKALRAWSRHSALRVIDNSVDFEDKINRAVAEVYRIVGQPVPQTEKSKYLIRMPDCEAIQRIYNAVAVEMMQTYLTKTNPRIDRRVRQQKNGSEYLYFYTEKRMDDDGRTWVTEKPVSEKEYVALLMEGDNQLRPVRKTKYRFACGDRRMEIDVYPFCEDKAVLFVYGKPSAYALIPPELRIISDVTGNPDYKNRTLAMTQKL